MCRILAVFSSVPLERRLAARIADGFVAMAAGDHEYHEAVPEHPFFEHPEKEQHLDGYGFAVGHPSREPEKTWHHERYPIPVTADPKSVYRMLLQEEPVKVALARLATVGKVAEENTHPFKIHEGGETSLYFQNGSVPEQFLAGVEPVFGTTDSEAFGKRLARVFHEKGYKGQLALLRELPVSITYVWLGKRVVVGQKAITNDPYPRLYGTNIEGGFILSSERLATVAPARDWKMTNPIPRGDKPLIITPHYQFRALD